MFLEPLKLMCVYCILWFLRRSVIMWYKRLCMYSACMLCCTIDCVCIVLHIQVSVYYVVQETMFVLCTTHTCFCVLCCTGDCVWTALSTGVLSSDWLRRLIRVYTHDQTGTAGNGPGEKNWQVVPLFSLILSACSL